MKILKILSIELLLVACASSPTVATKSAPIDQQVLKAVLESKTYDIPITAIVNMDGTKTNLLPNTTMSNGGNLSTTIQSDKTLKGEYYIRVRPNVIAVNLPFSGKSRTASLAYTSNEVVSKNLDYNNLSYQVTTKGSYNYITIKLNEKVENLKTIEIEIDKNGTASIKANKIADQVVSYEGYIYN